MRGAFEAFDTDRDEKLNAKDWEVFRAMMASENSAVVAPPPRSGDSVFPSRIVFSSASGVMGPICLWRMTPFLSMMKVSGTP